MNPDRELFRIAPRFCGPPDSGNGGYVAGSMAKVLSRREAERVADQEADRQASRKKTTGSLLETGVRVRLLEPPPLETDLIFEATEKGLGLFQPGLPGKPIAEAWIDDLVLDSPLPASFPSPLETNAPAHTPASDRVDLDRAVAASRGFRGFEEHVFPGCFVCGPDREEGDGLRIFPGALDSEGEVFAAAWQPESTLRDPDAPNQVDPAFVWAALDCPGCFSFPQPENAIVLLGELSAALYAPVPIDEPAILLSWQIEHKGRKHTTGSSVHDTSGRRLAAARGVWIEVARGR
jgi:hypothetical protein